MYPFNDGRNQESTGEAINAWYGLYLWGLASSNTDITNLGRLLLAQETRSAQKYYHMPSSSSIYPEDFKAKKTVGILWQNKSDYTTWFSAGA
ncbi:MAG: glycosyl hydrolase [Candidatus Saccharibacteria bacterium]